jgi:SlyX protein
MQEQRNDVERRLTDLEVKASFTEDLVDHLNLIVASQQERIERLLLEVARLREQGSSGDAEAFRSLRDELPPHY